MKRSLLLAAWLCGSSLLLLRKTSASPCPCRSLPCGRPLDTSAHLLAKGAQQSLGSITVTNKPGAGGTKGVELIAKAKPQENLVVMGAVAHMRYCPIWGRRCPMTYTRTSSP